MWKFHRNDICHKVWGISLRFCHMEMSSQMKFLADLVEMRMLTKTKVIIERCNKINTIRR